MTMHGKSWNGAQWWKCDLHTHTPGSNDYGKGPLQQELRKRTSREWLLDYMCAGIDCVAITDHNSGIWIDGLKEALTELEAEAPDSYRPLHLFPGVEISVNGGVHVLAVFGSEKSTSDIDSLLGAAGFTGTKGSSDSVTSKSFQEVVTEITRAGGIAIPAHADCVSGLFKLTGTTLTQALDCRDVFAVEIADSTSAKPTAFVEKEVRWTELVGSDAHHPSGGQGQRYPGSHYAWVKMGEPNIDGLRLALRDGPLSIKRFDTEISDPNEHAALVLESMEVAQARYMGWPEPFTLMLSPWLNAIVGGRGTGKSTTVEFLRIALNRRDELPGELNEDFAKYSTTYKNREDSGLLTDAASMVVVYRKDGARFRLVWSKIGEQATRMEEETDGEWRAAEGDVQQRFPVRIYSQKQIFQLAKTPLALLKIVDDAPEVGRREWAERWKELENRYLSLLAKAREISTGLADEPSLKGELDDVKRKLAVFEATGHADVLKEFQERTRQQKTVVSWQEGWSTAGDRLRDLASGVVPTELKMMEEEPGTSDLAQLYVEVEKIRKQFAAIRNSLDELATQADQVGAEWIAALNMSLWKQSAGAALRAYEELLDRLKSEGAGDPAAYAELVKRRQEIEGRLQDFEQRRTEERKLQAEAAEILNESLEHRRTLTEARRSFLEGILNDNKYVQVKILPYGARESVEADLRKLIQREQRGFEKDVGSSGGEGLLGQLYRGGSEPASVETGLSDIKKKLRSIASHTHNPNTLSDQRFAVHIQGLPPEVFDRADVWFPEDSLEVSYSPSGDREHFRPIAEGSPGQRTAALLAFLLSYGDEPLVLDQPEDDLDNHLIYDLIVKQLREVKRRRQIIVVTHNSNIVVNGDAELVIALKVAGGQTQKECEGCLQEYEVREAICKIMEGGRDAFQQRYQRIALDAWNS